VRALSIFAVPRNAQGMFPDYNQRDAAARAKMDRMFDIFSKDVYGQRDIFLAAPNSKAIALIDADHYIHRSNEADVLNSIIDFGAAQDGH
jgi:hypothetical protein